MENNSTINYYNENSEKFIASTINIDMSNIYSLFLKNIKPNARILDAGCGSGRDSKYFKSLGYEVEAFDASQKLCDSATQHIGQEVQCSTFREYYNKDNKKFDAIWACASLLHIQKNELKENIQNLIETLNPGGIFYTSFKDSNDLNTENERQFTDMTIEELKDFLVREIKLEVIELWVTKDARTSRSNIWSNIICRTPSTV
jgi:2-polyprenyl-3-methyl-5-hydroxy-6-metoxy-1,4-benzoquinol methylase